MLPTHLSSSLCFQIFPCALKTIFSSISTPRAHMNESRPSRSARAMILTNMLVSFHLYSALSCHSVMTSIHSHDSIISATDIFSIHSFFICAIIPQICFFGLHAGFNTCPLRIGLCLSTFFVH